MRSIKNYESTPTKDSHKRPINHSVEGNDVRNFFALPVLFIFLIILCISLF